LIALLWRERDPWLWTSAVFISLAVAPVAEEIVFRLALFETVRARLPDAAGLLSALAFAGAHQIPEAVPGLCVLGLVLQRQYLRHQTLWVPIALHAGFNAACLLVLVAVRVAAL